MKFSVTLLLLGLLTPALNLTAAPPQGLPTAAPESEGMSSPRLELVATMLRQHVDDGQIAGLVAGVARHGKVVFLESMGWQQIESQLPMQDDSIFEIRSMSKPITAVAVMQLVEQGKLHLTDTVAAYIPSFAAVRVFNDPTAADSNDTRPPSRPIIIEDLLLNTAGLSHRFGALYREQEVRSRADTLEQLVDTRISDWLWYFCPCDQSSRLDFRGFLERNQATEGDTQWVNYKPRPFSSRSTGF